MSRRSKTVRAYLIPGLLLLLLITFLWAQENQLSYLSQKLMLENNLRERVENALTKLLDDIKFVVDVSVELEFKTVQEAQSYATTTAPGSQDVAQPSRTTPSATPSPTTTPPAEQEAAPDRSMPLPGFEMPEELLTQQSQTPQKAQEMPAEQAPGAEQTAPTERRVPPGQKPGSQETVYQTSRSFPVVKRQRVKIILEDGVTPEIIENVRQVASVAAHLDRKRGDELSIMTSPFKKREPKDETEAVILKNIAEKIEDLEARQRAAERRAQIEEEKRLKRQAIMRDSTRIAELKAQITDLKEQIEKPQITEEERTDKQKITDAREEELASLRAKLQASNQRLAELEKGILDTTPPELKRSFWEEWLVLIIAGAIILVLLIILIILLARRNRERRRELEWGYGSKIPMGEKPSPPAEEPAPPEPPASPAKTVTRPETPEQARETTAQPKAAAPGPSPQEKEEQTEEMKGIRQSVISMTVGQPKAASRIVKDWMEQQKKSPESEQGGV